MKQLLATLLLSAPMIAGVGIPLDSFAGGPEVGVRLGAVRLGERKDRDVLELQTCAGGKEWRTLHAVKLKVNEYPAEINSLKVIYGNGAPDLLHVKKTFQPGTTSRWIDLRGGDRCVKEIIVVGDTNSAGWHPGKQASVVFFGKH